MTVTTAPQTGTPHPFPGWTRPAGDRPPRAFLDLGAVLTAPGCARAWTRAVLGEWGASGLAADAELIASELVTNSVNACAGLDRAVIRLVLTLDQGELAMLVRDSHPAAPAAAQPGLEEESGRGLLIVEQLSDRCGWYPLQGIEPAKVTWAVITGPRRPGDEPFGGPRPDCLPDAGTAARTQPVPVLPVRPSRAPPLTTGMRAPRLVDLVILARVKAALERL